MSSQSQGFAPLTQTGVHLGPGNDTIIDEQLQPGSTATEVQVTGDASILEPARFSLGRTISAQETQNLPLTSRDPYNFILFQPGVSGHPNPENGIPRALNTNGLVDRVNFQLDGMVDTETDRYGLRLFAISDSYVQEIDTISNSFAPEFGNTIQHQRRRSLRAQRGVRLPGSSPYHWCATGHHLFTYFAQ